MNLTRIISIKERIATSSEFKPDEVDFILEAITWATLPAIATRDPVTIEHDGFTGVQIGSYRTLEGKRGVVLQQLGTRVVHVYGEKWIK